MGGRKGRGEGGRGREGSKVRDGGEKRGGGGKGRGEEGEGWRGVEEEVRKGCDLLVYKDLHLS